jgi:hypothetical protein
MKTLEQLKQAHHQQKITRNDVTLRIHRALSWLERAEKSDDADGRFIFLWIAFNAAYANETGEQRVSDGEQYNQFLWRLLERDNEKQIEQIIWQEYTNAIRVLLDNPYVFQPYWNHHNHIPGYENWQTSFNKAKQAAQLALMSKDTAKVINIVFNRLYTLRNQIVHGGATWNSSVNRDQLRDANKILGKIIPVIIDILINNVEQDWGKACYPVINS